MSVLEALSSLTTAQRVTASPVAPVEFVRQAGADGSETDLGRARYFSPVFQLDVETQTLVMKYRNPGDGNVERQIPSERELAAYKAERVEQARLETEAAKAESNAGPVENTEFGGANGPVGTLGRAPAPPVSTGAVATVTPEPVQLGAAEQARQTTDIAV